MAEAALWETVGKGDGSGFWDALASLSESYGDMKAAKRQRGYAAKIRDTKGTADDGK